VEEESETGKSSDERERKPTTKRNIEMEENSEEFHGCPAGKPAEKHPFRASQKKTVKERATEKKKFKRHSRRPPWGGGDLESKGRYQKKKTEYRGP